MLRTHLHNANFISEAGLLRFCSICTFLVIADLFVATSRNLLRNQGHILGVLHCWGAETTVLVTEGLRFTVWVPVIVGLVVSVPLLEGVIKISVKPVKLWNHMKVKWHLGVLVRLVLVASSNRVHHLVQIRVNDLVAKIVMRLLPVVLWYIG